MPLPLEIFEQLITHLPSREGNILERIIYDRTGHHIIPHNPLIPPSVIAAAEKYTEAKLGAWYISFIGFPINSFPAPDKIHYGYPHLSSTGDRLYLPFVKFEGHEIPIELLDPTLFTRHLEAVVKLSRRGVYIIGTVISEVSSFTPEHFNRRVELLFPPEIPLRHSKKHLTDYLDCNVYVSASFIPHLMIDDGDKITLQNRITSSSLGLIST